MKVNVIFILILLQTKSLFAQATFVVKAEIASVKLLPEQKSLYNRFANKFYLKTDQKSAVIKVEFLPGKVILNDSILTIIPERPGLGYLTLYQKKPNNTYVKIFEKTFNIIEQDEPILNFDGIQNDSSSQLINAIFKGYLYFQETPSSKEYNSKMFKVISFNMRSFGLPIDSLNTTGNRLSKEMRFIINKEMKEGGKSISFENVKYINHFGDTLLYKKSLRVFILEDKIDKLGM